MSRVSEENTESTEYQDDKPVTDNNNESPMTIDQSGGAGDFSDGAIIEGILQCLEEINLGFDFTVLDVLDDENAMPAQIEALKDQLGTVVSTRLYIIANSVHYGKVRSGNITKFIDVVKHLGSETTKSTAIFIALRSLAKTEELKIIFARNYATSKLSDIIARFFGLKGNTRSIVALGGLFIEMGKVLMLLYAEKEGIELGEQFIEEHYPSVGAKVIERFRLPQSLISIVDHQNFAFEKKESLSLSAVVHMAHAVVDQSFRRYGRLVVESMMPDPEGIIYTSTIGAILAGQFQTMDLGQYIKVIPGEYSEQEKHLLERSRSSS
jgi:HDOD domain